MTCHFRRKELSIFDITNTALTYYFDAAVADDMMPDGLFGQPHGNAPVVGEDGHHASLSSSHISRIPRHTFHDVASFIFRHTGFRFRRQFAHGHTTLHVSACRWAAAGFRHGRFSAIRFIRLFAFSADD